MDFRERYYSLTARQRQVLALVCSGLKYQQIAEMLGLKATGVASHVRTLMDTLGADSRLQLAMLVNRNLRDWS